MGVNKPRKIFIGIQKEPGQGKVYVYKYPNDDNTKVYSSESPEKYERRIILEEIKNKFSNTTIEYKAREYDLDKINKIIDEIPEIQQTDDVPDIDVSQEINDEKRKELNKWKTKLAANSWKSQQRSLRKKGKLEQDKIDSLNRLGMLWNPKENNWEKKFMIFRTYGLCDELEGWVKKQRHLFKKNDISNENLIRLKAINFPFNASSNEDFKFTKKSAWDLKNKIYDKKSELEKKEQKIRGVFEKEKKIKKKQILGDKEKRDKQIQKEVNSFYNRKFHYCSWSFIKELTQQEAKEKLSQIDKGFPVQSNRLKEFLDNESNKFKNEGRRTPSYVKGFYSDVNLDTLGPSEIYSDLSNFIDSSVDPKIRLVACQLMLKYIPFLNLTKSKFKEINYLISTYRKEKNRSELIYLRDYIKKYPLLSDLFSEKIAKIIVNVL